MQIFLAIGNLGQDPEVKYMPSGGAVCNVNMATNKKWTDRNTGERREATEWHRLVAFNRTAEIMAEYCHKGSEIFVKGELRTRKWETQNGDTRYTTEVVVQELKLIGSQTAERSSGQRSQPSGNGGQPRQDSASTQSHDVPVSNDFDDDIPFSSGNAA